MKKSLGVVCAIAIALATLAGCSSSGGGSQSSGASSSPKAVVTLIQNKTEIQQQLEAAAKEFNSSQNNYEVKVLGSAGDNLVQVLQSQFASDPKTAPTLFTCQSGSEFDKFFNYMAPMDSAKSAKLMVKSQVADATKDGKVYGLPLTVEGFGLVYNKSIFKQAGVDPASIKSMADLVVASEKISKVNGVKKPIAFSKETYFSFMQPFNWPFAVMNNYADSIKKVEQGKLKLKDIPEVEKYAEDLAKLKPYTNLALDSYDDQVVGFAQGKYAMIHQGTWVQPLLDKYKINFKYGMMSMPFNGNTGLAVGNTNYFHINKAATPEQQKGAIAFLDWLFTNPTGQKYVTDKFKLIPAYTGFNTSSLGPLAQDVSKASNEGKTVPWTFNMFPAGIDKDGASAMQKFYAGQSTPSQLLDELTSDFVNASSNK
jgi:raffinose/stachyose/melibiose transport system substrate-binding protein